ncbi:hypothetical protein JKP88DRAFT_148843, partial [Tribonema minus]
EGLEPSTLTLTLVSSRHSLWGHLLWNASIRLAEMFDGGEVDLKGKTVLELGAGAGLPGLIAALCGASTVLITDYGTSVDHTLVEAIRRNIDALSPHVPKECLHAAPHVWGGSVQPLLDVLGEGHKFDVILLADLLFNRSEHRKLLQTCSTALAPGGTVWVTWGHHDPPKAPLDLKFFEIAAAPHSEGGFDFELEHLPPVQYVDLFEEHDGMDEARGVVYT